MNDNENHYKAPIVWAVIGMSWGALSYAYAGSIIGTTLGKTKMKANLDFARELSVI